MKVEASAPAKLVLVGEYAVLEGAPALVAAVDRRVHVTLTPSPDASWHVSSDLGGGRSAVLDLAPEAPEPEPWLRPVRHVVRRLEGAAGLPPQHVRIESAALFVDAGSTKLGLGSSAAVVTALTAALEALLGRAGPLSDPAEALAARRALHGGGGSGVDLAASLLGGVLVYRLAHGRPTVTPAELPPDLAFAVIWTGRPASTADFLQRVGAWGSRAPEAWRTRVAHMSSLAERAVQACRDADAEAFLGLVRAYREAMDDLGRASGVPILSPAHAAITGLVEGDGLAYKPSGAGGGDVGLLFARSRAALVHAGRMAERAGYRLLDLGIHPAGVRVRSQETPSP